MIDRAPLQDALKRAYYYDDSGAWREVEDTTEWDRWHAVANVVMHELADAIDSEQQRRNVRLAAEMRDVMSFPPLPPSPAEVGDLILQTREYVQELGWGNREALYPASQVRAMMSECAIMATARARAKGTL